jgi:hypothetical protein
MVPAFVKCSSGITTAFCVTLFLIRLCCRKPVSAADFKWLEQPLEGLSHMFIPDLPLHWHIGKSRVKASLREHMQVTTRV